MIAGQVLVKSVSVRVRQESACHTCSVWLSFFFAPCTETWGLPDDYETKSNSTVESHKIIMCY